MGCQNSKSQLNQQKKGQQIQNDLLKENQTPQENFQQTNQQDQKPTDTQSFVNKNQNNNQKKDLNKQDEIIKQNNENPDLQYVEQRRQSILNERIQANKLGLSRSKYDEYLKFLKDQNLEQNDDNLKQFLGQQNEQYQQQLSRRKSYHGENIKSKSNSICDFQQRKKSNSQDQQILQSNLPQLQETQKLPQNITDKCKLKNRLSVIAQTQQLNTGIDTNPQVSQEIQNAKSNSVNQSFNNSTQPNSNQQSPQAIQYDEYDEIVQQINKKEDKIKQKYQKTVPNFNTNNPDYIKEVAGLGIGEQGARVWTQLSENDKKEHIKRRRESQLNGGINPLLYKDMDIQKSPVLQQRRLSDNTSFLSTQFGLNATQENRRQSQQNPSSKRKSLFAQ